MDCGTDERQYGHGGDGDAAEWKKVAELREFVEAQDPSAKVPQHIYQPSPDSSSICRTTTFNRTAVIDQFNHTPLWMHS